MNIVRVEAGERRMPWYWAVVLLLPISGVAVAVFFTPLALWWQSQPPRSIPFMLVIGGGAAASLAAFATWRFVLLWLLRGSGQQSSQAEASAADVTLDVKRHLSDDAR